MARNASREPDEPVVQEEPPKGRFRQFFYALRVYRQIDPKITLWVSLYGGGAAVVVFLLVFLLTGMNVLGIVFGVLLGVLAGATGAILTLNRRGQRAVYARWDGQPGAALQALKQGLRRGWVLQEAVQVNRQADAVHRLIGQAGVLLVAEGAPNRVTALVTTEKRNLTRLLGPEIVPEVIIVGKDEEAGQVPLGKLVPMVTRRGLRGRKLTTLQVSEYSKRLAAVDRGPLGGRLPKGPMPRGGKLPRGSIR